MVLLAFLLLRQRLRCALDSVVAHGDSSTDDERTAFATAAIVAAAQRLSSAARCTLGKKTLHFPHWEVLTVVGLYFDRLILLKKLFIYRHVSQLLINKKSDLNY